MNPQNIGGLNRMTVLSLLLLGSSIWAATNEVAEIHFPLFARPYMIPESVSELREKLKSENESATPYYTFLLGMKLYAQSNYTECAKAFVKASDIGFPDASFAAFVCFAQEIGVERDMKRAFFHLNRSVRYPCVNALKVAAKSSEPMKRLLLLKYAALDGDSDAAFQLRTNSASMTDEEHRVAFESPQLKPRMFAGLKTFSVRVSVDGEIKRLFDAEQIRHAAELRLRSSGLRVAPNSAEKNQIHELVVTVNGVLTQNDKLLSWTLSVSCIDIVSHRFTPMLCSIYSDGAVGIYSSDRFEKMYDRVEREVAKFCNIVLADQD